MYSMYQVIFGNVCAWRGHWGSPEAFLLLWDPYPCRFDLQNLLIIHISNENYAIDNQLAHHLEVDFEGELDFRLPKACRVFNKKIPNSLQLLHVGVKEINPLVGRFFNNPEFSTFFSRSLSIKCWEIQKSNMINNGMSPSVDMRCNQDFN